MSVSCITASFNCNYVIQGKRLTDSLPWPLCVAEEPDRVRGPICKEVNHMQEVIRYFWKGLLSEILNEMTKGAGLRTVLLTGVMES